MVVVTRILAGKGIGRLAERAIGDHRMSHMEEPFGNEKPETYTPEELWQRIRAREVEEERERLEKEKEERQRKAQREAEAKANLQRQAVEIVDSELMPEVLRRITDGEYDKINSDFRIKFIPGVDVALRPYVCEEFSNRGFEAFFRTERSDSSSGTLPTKNVVLFVTIPDPEKIDENAESPVADMPTWLLKLVALGVFVCLFLVITLSFFL